MTGRKMHQTTVRFGPDLWTELSQEAELSGVSVAQYVRDAALVRVVHARARRGDTSYDAALIAAQALGDGLPPSAHSGDLAHRRAADNVEAAAALTSQSAQTRRQSELLRYEARRRRDTKS